MRIVVLLVGLSVATLAAVGVSYYPHLLYPELKPVYPPKETARIALPDNFALKIEEIDWPKVLADKAAYAREHLGFESLAERLPKGKPIRPTKALNAESRLRWQGLDEQLARAQDSRAELLKAYHEKTRQFFVKSPGQGSERWWLIRDSKTGKVEWSGDEHILLDDRLSSLDQLGEPAMFPESLNEPLTRVDPIAEFYADHDGILERFLHPRGFGYFKDREHVAGFNSHGFRSFDDYFTFQDPKWQVQHVLLVGILQHEQPVVYLTDKLPSMEQVRQGKTRPLDTFEEAAFPSLCEGEDLYIVSKDKTLRMLGAIRATKTCLQCHDAQVGDLLGAFSYTLRYHPIVFTRP
jgi:hypothetical protein